MSEKELVREVLQGTEAGCHPVGVHSVWPAAEMSPYSIGECSTNGEKMAKAQVDFQRKHRMDIIHLEIGVGPLAEAMGAEVSWPEDRQPIVRNGAIESLTEIEDLDVPDPFEDGKLPELLEMTQLVKEDLGEEVFVIGEADQGPFNLAAQLVGIERILTKITKGKNLNLIEELISITTEATERLAKAQIDSGADATCIGESYASPDIISPDFYRNYVKPAHKNLSDHLEKLDIDWALHICGDVTKILPDLNEVQPTILEVDYKTDLPSVKKEIKRSTVLGTIDPKTFVNRGEGSMEEEVEKNLRYLTPGGHFIPHSGCTLPSDAPDETIEKFLELVRKRSTN